MADTPPVPPLAPAARTLLQSILAQIQQIDVPPRFNTPELIDDDTQPYADFRASMTDVQRANRFLGGTRVVTRQMQRWFDSEKQLRDFAPSGDQYTVKNSAESAVGSALLADDAGASSVQLIAARPLHCPITILDIATGSGDLPTAISEMADRRGIAVRIVGLDFSEPILRFAREEVGGQQGIRLLRGDAFRLPFADGSFDYVLCSLAFHHFDFDECVTALKEMERVSRRGWIVNDVRRAWSAWWLIRIITRVIGVNRLTRHDAPASVRRAYSLAEFAAMPAVLGLQVGERVEEVRLRRSLFYRMALIRNKPTADYSRPPSFP